MFHIYTYGYFISFLWSFKIALALDQTVFSNVTLKDPPTVKTIPIYMNLVTI